jgi:hypothetical protein
MNRLLELDAYLDEVIEFGIGRIVRRGASQARKGATKAIESQDAQTRYKIAQHLKRRKAYVKGYKQVGKDNKRHLGDKGSFVRGQLRQSERTGTIGAKTVGTLRGSDRRIYKAGSKEGQKRVRQLITKKGSGKSVQPRDAKRVAKAFQPAVRQEAIFSQSLRKQAKRGKGNAMMRARAQNRAQRIAVQG